MTDDTIYAPKGSFIYCDNGHKLYTLADDVTLETPIMAALFVPVHRFDSAPNVGDAMTCVRCGAPWRVRPGGARPLPRQ
jgi:hypothetical protein